MMELPEAAVEDKRLAKKRKLKQMFDAEYDETAKHYHSLKEEMEAQAQVRCD